MRTVTLLLGAALAATGPFAATTPAPAQSAGSPAGAATPDGGAQPDDAAAASYGSYLSAPAQDNVMLRGGLDADELIGSEVVAADGTRIGAVTDLLVGADGAITHAAVDAGQALGMGSRHVAVDIARLQRTEESPTTFRLAPDGRQLADMTAYRQTGDRWEAIP